MWYILLINTNFFMGETPEECVNNAIAEGKIEDYWELMSGDTDFELWEMGKRLNLTVITKDPEYIIKPYIG